MSRDTTHHETHHETHLDARCAEMLAALRSFAELPSWLAHPMDAGRVRTALLRDVPELADGRQRLIGCEPSRLRAKGERWVARYHLVVADRDTDHHRPVVLVGELEPPTGAGPARAWTTSRFGAPDWQGWLPDLRLRLRTEIGDHALPALPVLIDPDAARALLERGIGRQTFPGIRIAEAVPEILRHKPGSRCTLRYQLRYAAPQPAWPTTVVVKIHQGDKGANAFAAMQALWAAEPARGGPVTLARPLAYLPAERVLVQAAIPGAARLTDTIRATLFAGDQRPAAELRAQLEATARGLAALHGSGVRHGRVHTWADELAEVRGLTARLGTTFPELATAADPLLARLQRLADAAPADPPGPAHHDFRPGQVLVHGAQVGFIDFDGFCTAEPALDVGRFRAKLRDIGVFAKDTEVAAPSGAQLMARMATLDELCDGFLATYRSHAPVSSARVRLWETIDLFTAVLHAWTKVRFARVTPRLELLEHQIRRLAESQVD